MGRRERERGDGDVGVPNQARLMHSSRASVDSWNRSPGDDFALISCRIRVLRRRCFIGCRCTRRDCVANCRWFCRFLVPSSSLRHIKTSRSRERATLSLFCLQRRGRASGIITACVVPDSQSSSSSSSRVAGLSF